MQASALTQTLPVLSILSLSLLMYYIRIHLLKHFESLIYYHVYAFQQAEGNHYNIMYNSVHEKPNIHINV